MFYPTLTLSLERGGDLIFLSPPQYIGGTKGDKQSYLISLYGYATLRYQTASKWSAKIILLLWTEFHYFSGLAVGVALGLAVGVAVGLAVGVAVGLAVGVAVAVGLAVGVGLATGVLMILLTSSFSL